MLRKFFTTVAVGSLFVGGLAATHVAFADEGAPGGRHGGRGGMMMQADANKDGTISKAELTAALEARFAKMDANRDGKIDQADRAILRQQRNDARFAALDADKNGQISKAEFTAGHEKRFEDRAEKQGGADGKRWGKGPRGGRHHGGPGGFGPGGPGRDGDKDGTLTKAEFMARPLAMFDKADVNKDGSVTTAEMQAARAAMRAEWKDRKGPPQAGAPAPTN